MVLLRRINNEINKIKELYPNTKITFKDPTLIILVNDLHINIVINDDYPFKAIKNITINNQKYLDIIFSLDRYYVNKMVGEICLCCKSLTCQSNWSPTIRIYQILEEIINIMNIKNKIENQKTIPMVHRLVASHGGRNDPRPSLPLDICREIATFLILPEIKLL